MNNVVIAVLCVCDRQFDYWIREVDLSDRKRFIRISSPHDIEKLMGCNIVVIELRGFRDANTRAVEILDYVNRLRIV